MKLTVRQYCAMKDIRFVTWGFLAEWYRILGITFRNSKWLNKSVDYLDKRWDMMVRVLENKTQNR